MYVRLVVLLYFLCFVLLIGLSLFVAFMGRDRPRPQLRQTFCLLASYLLIWEISLFLEVRFSEPSTQLLLGRVNFAAIVFVVFYSVYFVLEVSHKKANHASSWFIWLYLEAVGLALITLFTPLVDAAERVESDHAISTYGPLYPLYLIHVILYLSAALVALVRDGRRAEKRALRDQLQLIGLGMLATSAVSLVTNALLPYLFNDFSYCDLGPLSTLLFAVAVGWAAFVYHLFDLRIVLRETLVYGFLLSFVLAAYSSTVFLVTQYFTDGADKITQFAVLVIAFSFDPLRRVIEMKSDRLLFGGRQERDSGKKKRARKKV